MTMPESRQVINDGLLKSHDLKKSFLIENKDNVDKALRKPIF